MKKVELNFELKNLNDQDVGNAGVLLAELLISETKGNAIKLFEWAMKLNKKEAIEVDSSDLIMLKTLLNETERLPMLAKAQILIYLETLK